MLASHYRLGGKVFSVNLLLPAWWKIILSRSVRLLDPENIGLEVDIAFQSCLQADISVLPVNECHLGFSTSGLLENDSQ